MKEKDTLVKVRERPDSRLRSGISGISLCDLDVYQVSVNGKWAFPDVHNFKIYADDYFILVPLVVKHLDRVIHYVGSARQVRFLTVTLMTRKTWTKKGGRSFGIRVESNIICTVNICGMTRGSVHLLVDQNLCRLNAAMVSWGWEAGQSGFLQQKHESCGCVRLICSQMLNIYNRTS